jgi:uncharacterized membrane protein
MSLPQTIAKNLSKRNRNKHLQPQQPQTTIVASHQQLRIAPLPTPNELAQFDQVLPGLAERIVRMAEQNGEDRRRTNRTIRWVTMLGQIFAFIIMMTALAGGFYLVNSGKDTAGIAAIITAIGVPLATFVYSRARARAQQQQN